MTIRIHPTALGKADLCWGKEAQGSEEIETAPYDRMTYEGDDDDSNYFGDDVDEVDIPPARGGLRCIRFDKSKPLRSVRSRRLYGRASVNVASSLTQSLSGLYRRSSSVALLANKRAS